ncbi:integrase [Nonomuraea sp. NPDC050540]|uniref:integrase n=1 Tax=Nonomuraea sp. NPDC050540 TaxID=3364367 RepID=UPI0037AC983C
MSVQVASEAGSPFKSNEDLAVVGPDRLLILDGLTQRTESGCVHGVVWYVNTLASAVMKQDGHSTPVEILSDAVRETASLHAGTCDLSHPGTPAAAVGLVQFFSSQIRYLILGDITLLIDGDERSHVIADDRLARVNASIHAEIDVPAGDSPEREIGLIRRKHAELAVRNSSDGYWVAAADPTVVSHAVTGEQSLADVRQLAVLTDGAARPVDPFKLMDWRGLMSVIAAEGPEAVLRHIRKAEREDSSGRRWPRNKMSDDATIIYWRHPSAGGSDS